MNENEDHAETVKGYGDFRSETEYILHYDVTMSLWGGMRLGVKIRL